MKKFLLFAMAMLSLVACKKNNDEAKAPTHKIVLNAMVGMHSSNGPLRVAPVDPTAATVEFEWEEDDRIIIKDAGGMHTFQIINSSISEDRKTAQFEGEIIGELSAAYEVYYNLDLTSDYLTIPYVANSFKPIAVGNGDESGFILDTFYPVLGLQLTGTDKISKIEYYPAISAVEGDKIVEMPIEGGLQLTNTATPVYIPVKCNNNATGMFLKFYNMDGNLIMSQLANIKIDDTKMGKIIDFPVLEVKSPSPTDIFVDGNTLELKVCMAEQRLIYSFRYQYANQYFNCQHIWQISMDDPTAITDQTANLQAFCPANKTAGQNNLEFKFGNILDAIINVDPNPATCSYTVSGIASDPKSTDLTAIIVNDVDITNQFSIIKAL